MLSQTFFPKKTFKAGGLLSQKAKDTTKDTLNQSLMAYNETYR